MRPETGSGKREWVIAAAMVALGCGLLAVDVSDDLALHAPVSHIVEEIAFVLAALAAFVYVVVKGGASRRAVQRLNAELGSVRQDLKHYHHELGCLSRGLGERIDRQIEAWGLTPSEAEVASLLLKGLGHRRIAELRGTSEKTVRQQAAAVYRKAGVEGRAELSAYFLEDLLVLESPPASDEAGLKGPATRRSPDRGPEPAGR